MHECGGGCSFTARGEGNETWQFLRTQTLCLPNVRSGYGVEYTEGQLTFWSKGDEAVLEIGGERHAFCLKNRAKLSGDAIFSGKDFRAYGNEPGCHLEIAAGRRFYLPVTMGTPDMRLSPGGCCRSARKQNGLQGSRG